MKIEITDAASAWFKDEMGLEPGNGVRFYGKVYGKTPVHDGFSLAMTRDDYPNKVYAKTEKDGSIFFVDIDDEWFFKGYDLVVDYNPEKDDFVQFNYVENNELN